MKTGMLAEAEEGGRCGETGAVTPNFGGKHTKRASCAHKFNQPPRPQV